MTGCVHTMAGGTACQGRGEGREDGAVGGEPRDPRAGRKRRWCDDRQFSFKVAKTCDELGVPQMCLVSSGGHGLAPTVVDKVSLKNTFGYFHHWAAVGAAQAAAAADPKESDWAKIVPLVTGLYATLAPVMLTPGSKVPTRLMFYPEQRVGVDGHTMELDFEELTSRDGKLTLKFNFGREDPNPPGWEAVVYDERVKKRYDLCPVVRGRWCRCRSSGDSDAGSASGSSTAGAVRTPSHSPNPGGEGQEIPIE